MTLHHKLLNTFMNILFLPTLVLAACLLFKVFASSFASSNFKDRFSSFLDFSFSLPVSIVTSRSLNSFSRWRSVDYKGIQRKEQPVSCSNNAFFRLEVSMYPHSKHLPGLVLVTMYLYLCSYWHNQSEASVTNGNFCTSAHRFRIKHWHQWTI